LKLDGARWAWASLRGIQFIIASSAAGLLTAADASSTRVEGRQHDRLVH